MPVTMITPWPDLLTAALFAGGPSCINPGPIYIYHKAVNPLSPHDALKHRSKSLYTDLIF